MPHLTVEYSANLDHELDVPGLLRTLHDVTASMEAFPLAGLRTRAERRDLYVIADAHPDNSFVHVTLRIGHGRELAVRQAAGDTLYAALTAHLAPLSACRPLAISLEMQELDPFLNYKGGTIREHMAKRSA